MSNRHPVISKISSTNSTAGNAMNCCASRFGAFLVCAAIFSLKVYQQPETARVATQSPLTLSVPVNAEQEWNLASPVGTQIFRTQPVRSFRESAQTHRAAPPRYVLDSVPVSYEPTFRF